VLSRRASSRSGLIPSWLQVRLSHLLLEANLFATEKQIDSKSEEGGKEEEATAVLEDAKVLLQEARIPEASQKFSEAFNMKVPAIEPLALAGLGRFHIPALPILFSDTTYYKHSVLSRKTTCPLHRQS